MKTSFLFTRVIFVALLLFLFMIGLEYGRRFSLARQEKEIVQQMERANHCQKDGDCAVAVFACPFGCGVYMHKEEIAPIQERIAVYHKRQRMRCHQTCASLITPVCRAGVCVAKPCQLSQNYQADFPHNCLCPRGSQSVVTINPQGVSLFSCQAGPEL